jgi:hypothetical protein
MPLIKKVDVKKHFAARRSMRLAARGPLSQPDGAVSTETVPSGKGTNAQGIVEDLSLGTSSSIASVTPIE